MKMTKKEIREAAKGAATTALDLGKFVKDGAVGKLLRDAGVINVGLSMYVFSKSRLEDAINAVGKEIAENGHEPETYATFVELQRKLIAEYNVTAKGIVESIKTEEPRQKGETSIVLPANTVFTAVAPSKLEKDESEDS